ALASCHLCAAGDPSLHCPQHHQTCAVCRRETCTGHQVRLHDGRVSCKGCAVTCSTCAKFFPQAETAPCQECGKASCPKHTEASQFRAERYCSAHAARFVSCPGCDRRGPGKHLA